MDIGQALGQECYFPGVFCDDVNAPAILVSALWPVMSCHVLAVSVAAG